MIESDNKLPKHIAFIMDGNRRWAAINSLPANEGHKCGVKAIKEIISYGRELGISYMTFFVFSSENWMRKQEEVGFLMDLFFKSFSRAEYGFLKDNSIRIKFIGRKDRLTPIITERMQECEKYTAAFDGININLAFNYGARQEITDAVVKLSEAIKGGELKIAEISENKLSEYLYSSTMPDPDLLIRTSGECRVSNFLLWQIAYCELYFTETLWPDFNRECLDLALHSYQNRKRRYGK